MNKKTKILIITVIVALGLLAAVLAYSYISKSGSLTLHSTEVGQGTITEKINLTGQVKASQGVDLAFEGSGKIVANYVKVGDKIYAGQPLMAIDSSLLQAQLKQAQAQLATLDINTVESKTNSGLETLYVNSLSAAQKSVTTAKDLLLTLSDIQYSHFSGQIPQNTALQDIKAEAVLSLLGQQNAGLWTSQNLSQLNGGAFASVQNAIDNPTHENIDSALSAAKTALQDVGNLINAMPINSSLTATERATISAAKTSINAEIITTSANIQAISAQKVNNSATITTTQEQINAAKATVDAIQTQISKTTIRALFAGQVDKNDAIVGAIVSAGTPVITISNNNLEIQTNIPESEIANVKVSSPANVTLDAFGTSEVFPATVVSIDSVQSLENGISVYKARLKLTNADERIRAGMTANITIMPETHSNVLTVPKTAVIQKDGKYFVIVDLGNSQKETREVTTGLKDDKNVEIISGLNLGDKVLAY